MSVSVATIDFAKSSDGTALTWTEQGAFLDGIDGPEAPAHRKEGTAEMLAGLVGYLASQAEHSATDYSPGPETDALAL